MFTALRAAKQAADYGTGWEDFTQLAAIVMSTGNKTRLTGIVAHLQGEIAALEKRLQQVEQHQAKAMSWAGIWKAKKRYREGEITQKSGGLWLCLADTNGATPGQSPHWRLVVKAGSFNGMDAHV